jgi:CTP synthase (UTP-ammonia lyase)
MTKPSPSLLNQQNLHVLGLCDVMQVFVGDFVRQNIFIFFLRQILWKLDNMLMILSVINNMEAHHRKGKRIHLGHNRKKRQQQRRVEETYDMCHEA